MEEKIILKNILRDSDFESNTKSGIEKQKIPPAEALFPIDEIRNRFPAVYGNLFAPRRAYEEACAMMFIVFALFLT
jgi:hypothetical protein